jgi:hypothetical protein
MVGQEHGRIEPTLVLQLVASISGVHLINFPSMCEGRSSEKVGGPVG